MALRMIEVFLPLKYEGSLGFLEDDKNILGCWRENFEGGQMLRILLHAEDTEELLDNVHNKLSGIQDFRVIVFPVEATLPRPETEAKTAKEVEGPQEEEKPKPLRISREELYDDIADSARISYVYVIMIILSTIVAAVGLLNNNVTVIIGAMVIAPLLGPNVALSLATTLGDTVLVRRALTVNLIGILAGLFISVGIGYFFHASPMVPEISARTRVGLTDIVTALASGSAGVLAFTTGVPAILIGVMVAVALLPPLVVFGMLLGSGATYYATGALLLLLTNLICVNLSGVITLLIQGIMPVRWWESDRAKKATRKALAMWFLLLVALVAIILISKR